MKESRARTERPILPKLPAELVEAERLKPLTGDRTGDLVSIDRGTLRELTTRLGEAIGIIERDQNRKGGVRRLWACIDVIWRTGKAPEGCEAR